jgi:alpha-L-fucosidase
MNTKGLNMDQRKCLVRDIERGKNETIDPNPWQTDTCIGGWHYDAALFQRHGYKKPDQVIAMLLDIISKNGNLLLNIPVKGDGTIDSDEEAILESMASWMAVNSQSIYGTRPWSVYGEGPSTTSNQDKGHFGGLSDVSKTPFAPDDFRFVVKGNVLFVSALGGLEKSALIKSLATGTTKCKVKDVTLLGNGEKLDWKQGADGLLINSIPGKLATPYIPVFKVTLDAA